MSIMNDCSVVENTSNKYLHIQYVQRGKTGKTHYYYQNKTIFIQQQYEINMSIEYISSNNLVEFLIHH